MFDKFCYFISNISMLGIISIEAIKYKLSFINFNRAIINICEKIRKINVLYVKMLQWSLQDYFSIDDELKQYFYTFNSNVPYNNDDVDHKLLNRLEQKFKDVLVFNKTPINSGTTALIFKGEFNGKKVAIKVLRKNMYEKIYHGVENIKNLLYIITYLLSFFYKITSKLQISLISNNKNLLLKQCDLLNEVKNIEIFKNAHRLNKDIVIPTVYKEFTEFDNGVIVMDYLEGSNINDVTKEKIQLYKSTVSAFILNSFLFFKVIHGDFHAGNILLMEDSCRIGIIDFGIIIEISKKQSNDIFKFFLGIKNADVNMLIKSLTNLILENVNDKDKLKNIIRKPLELVENDLFSKTGKLHVDRIVTAIQLLIVGIDGNVNVDPRVSYILLSIISSLHIIEKLDRGDGCANVITNHLKIKNFLS
jgi:predicted unusual protein kinase regulating ubiquinone biosynthesis (AarF/ABC1/UbiB family)